MSSGFCSHYNLVEIRYNVEQLSEMLVLNGSAKELQLARITDGNSDFTFY